MYILENAFCNVLQNKGRNLIICATIFAVIVVTVIVLMICSIASGISTAIRVSPFCGIIMLPSKFSDFFISSVHFKESISLVFDLS